MPGCFSCPSGRRCSLDTQTQFPAFRRLSAAALAAWWAPFTTCSNVLHGHSDQGLDHTARTQSTPIAQRQAEAASFVGQPRVEEGVLVSRPWLNGKGVEVGSLDEEFTFPVVSPEPRSCSFPISQAGSGRRAREQARGCCRDAWVECRLLSGSLSPEWPEERAEAVLLRSVRCSLCWILQPRPPHPLPGEVLHLCGVGRPLPPAMARGWRDVPQQQNQ